MPAIAVSSSSPIPAEAVVALGTGLRERGVDVGALEDPVALVFSSVHHAEDPVALCGALSDLLGPVPFAGWVGASAIHGLHLREGEPGLALLLLERAGAFVRTAGPAELGSHVAAALLADAPLGRSRLISTPAEGLDPDNFLPCFDEQGTSLAGAVAVSLQEPGSALASGLPAPARSALCVLDGYDLVLGVAQGARPLGPTRHVTRAEGHVIHELDGRPALEQLMTDLPSAQRQNLGSLQGSLLAGLTDDGASAVVMRHVLGVDPRTGAVAIGGQAQVGLGLSFHVRDGQAAREDLEATLHSMKASLGEALPEAVILFDCAGRNEATLGVENYDAGRVLDMLGDHDVPVVGVQGNGELATFGARSHLFAYTAVVAALLPVS